jgi:hypothetical protein
MTITVCSYGATTVVWPSEAAVYSTPVPYHTSPTTHTITGRPGVDLGL